MRLISEFINSQLAKFGYSLIRNSTLEKLHNNRVSLKLIGEWIDNCDVNKLGIEVSKSIAKGETTSQLQQDVIARYVNQNAPEPSNYFVEVGASDGVSISNTIVLEKLYSWNGILAEPARRWHRSLSENRRCTIDYRCVWNESGLTVEFQEMEVGEFSTIAAFISNTNSDFSGGTSRAYNVPTVTLLDLLRDYHSPSRIGFLSIDTEGSEFEILRSFDFSSYTFNFVAVEHNFGETRSLIVELFEANGYTRVLPTASKWDDWFVPSDLAWLFMDNHG
jgi:FkbM family methyltransferase